MRILIADDDRVSRRQLESHLAWCGYEVTSVDNGADALDALRGGDAPPIAVLDWSMPGMRGVDVVKQLRDARRENGPSYVILLTTHTDEEEIAEALECGADDYIVRPFNRWELRSRLALGQRVVEMRRRVLAIERDLDRLARTDSLTQLHNRTAVFDRLREELARARREDVYVAVMMCDVDRLKAVNDAHGHACGDEVIAGVAARLRSACRIYDAVGRCSGEEFLVVMPKTSPDDAIEAARRILRTVGGAQIETSHGPLEITVSIGLVVVDPDDGNSVDAVVRGAEAVLEAAKALGANQLQVSIPED